MQVESSAFSTNEPVNKSNMELKLRICSVLITIRQFAHSVLVIALALSLFEFAQQAHAEVIDRIDIKQAGDESEILLHFITHINYTRQEMLKNGDIRIYLNLQNIDPADPRLYWEKKNSPPSDIVPPFTITYPELDSSLTLSFDKIVKYRVSLGHDGRSISIFIPKSEVIRLEAERLYIEASNALQINQFDKSIGALGKLLNLPPNILTSSAQELLNEARVKKNEFAKLPMAIQPTDTAARELQDAQKAAKENMRITGGISQNYAKSMTRKNTYAINGTSPPVITTLTDTARLTTSLDLLAQKSSENLNTNLVLREENNVNYLPGISDRYLWNALYIEQVERNSKYLYRLGRQTGTSGGVQGLFDGVVAGYSLNQNWRVNATVGMPVEVVSGAANLAESKTFTSVSIDLNRLPNEWSGSVYLLRQYVGGFINSGILDRSSLGLEAHLFDAGSNYFTQMEYDSLFKKINFAAFQGNWVRESGTIFYVVADHRRSLPLAFNMQGQFSNSVKEVLDSGKVSTKTLRENAVALDPVINMVSIGMSRPYSANLQFATDFRVINVSGIGGLTVVTPALALTTLPGFPGNGNQYSYSLQAIGNNLFFKNDFSIANVTWTRTNTTKGQSLVLSQAQPLRIDWRLDAGLQLLSQSSIDGTNMTLVRPSLRANYRMNNSMNISAEGGLEETHISNPQTMDTKQLRKFYFIGYRWDFR